MTSGGGKVAAATGARRSRGKRPGVRIVNALLFGTALSSALPLLAQVTPGGPEAPRLDAAANGTRIVTINRPSPGGVSNNSYTDFNVGPGGLILNNSPRIVGTALAGYVDGNANLRQTGPASVILNQVVSTNRTTLAGYLEVAGGPAQVIVANANGITCGGCGFINAPFVTLTTGTPRLGADGGVAGFEVTRGTILIDGQGLDASGARLDLFARAVQLNAGLWADRVNVVAGAGSVTSGAGDGDVVVTARAADGAEAAPRFALDVAALGGMYAGSIRLIGSEAGLGVRVDGTLASLERGFTLGANGNVQIGGRVIAATTADVRSAGDVAIGGTLYGAGPVVVSANGAVANNGLTASGGNLSVNAGAVSSTGTLAAGLNRDGTSAATGDLSLTARAGAALAGQVVAPGALALRAAAIDLTGSAQVGTASVVADRIGVAATGQLIATGQATFGGGALINAGAIQGGVVTASLASLTNSGLVASTGAMALTTSGQLANSGTIQAPGATQLAAGDIANAGGTILASGTGALTLTSAGTLASRGGTVAGNGDVTVAARSIDVSGVGALAKPGQAGGNGQLSAGGMLRATATGGDLVADNGGLIAAGRDLTLGASGTVRAAAGTVSAGGVATLTGAAVVLDGGTLQSDRYVIDAGAISLRRTQLIQTGTADQLLRTTGTLDYSGAVFTTNATNFALQAGRIVNAGGELRHAGAGVLSLDAPVIDNHGGLIATAGTLRLTAGTLDNAGGTISAAGDAAVSATGSLGNARGVVVAGKALALTAGTVDNSTGDIESTGSLVARLGSLTGAGGQLKATGTGSALDLRADGSIEARGGLIGGNGAVTLASRSADLSGATLVGTSIVAGASGGDLLARGGIIQAGAGSGAGFRPGSVTLSATGTIDASAGGAIAGDAVKLTAERLDTSSGTLSAGRLDAALGALSNRGGTIVLTQTAPLVLTLTGALDNSGGSIATNASALTVQAASIANDGGRIAQAGTGLLTLSAGAIGNAGGTIASGGGYQVTAASLANAGGRLTGPGAGRLDVTGAVSNGGGLIVADAGLTLGTGALSNGGTIGSSGGALSLTAASLANGVGLIQAGGVTLSVRDGATNAVGGTIGSTGALSIAAGSLGNAGNVHADADATLNLGSLANTGQMSAGRQLSVSSGQLENGGSLLGSGITLTASGLGNAGGTISGDAVQVTVAGLLDNATGQIGGRALTLAAGSLANAGLLSSAGGAASDLSVTVVGALTNRAGGAIWADRNLAVTAGSVTNAGSIAGAGEAALTAGVIDNGAATGVLGAGNRLRLDFGDATPGRLALGGDLAINARGDWTLAAGQVIAGPRDVALTVAGTFANNGALSANRALTVGAAAIDNRAGARLAGDQLTLTAGATLANAGLINAGRSGVLTVGALDNRGQIFGDAMTVTATGAIGNAGAAAVIATRGGRLALFTPGAVTNTDGALIHSAGTLVIAGHEDTGSGYGRAGSILNGSATIEAAGAGLIGAGVLTNTRTTFTADRAVQSATYVSLPPIYSDSDHRTSERYTRTISDTAVTADSGAGRILFGGDLRIDAGTLANRWSTLSAAGNLSIEAGSLSNVALAATEFDDQTGVFFKEHYVCVSRFIVCLDHDWRDNGTDPLSRAFRTELGTLTPSVIAAGGALSINAGTLDNLLLDVDGNIVTAAGVLGGGTTGPGSAGAGAFTGDASAASVDRVVVSSGTQVALSTTGGAGAVGTVTDGGLVVGGTVGGRAATGVAPLGSATGLTAVAGVPARSAAAFQIGLGGLFGFASAPGRSFLIDTNGAFTNGAQFLSSDYFLNRLGYDPARVEQRLGDAYYEQELVGRQLAQLTGTTRLAGYGDNESQYRALLDAGVRYAQAFDLGVGVGLTAAQMASLTGDLVLLVDVVVQTPSGPQHALAPVVYLAAGRGADLASSGALIASGGALAVRTAGDLTNTGVIRGGTAASIAAGGTLVNGGVLASTGPLAVTAGGDLVSRAGQFSGSDVTLAAGGNVVLGSIATTARTVTVDGRGATAVDSLVNQVTRIDAADRLTVIARGNLASAGAQLTAGDTASVLVGGNATLGAINDQTQTVDWAPVRHGATSTTTVDETAVGTGINAANGVTVAAGLSDPTGRLSIAGGSITSDGRIALSGTGGVEVGAATERDSAATATFTRRSGFLSTTRTSSSDTITSDVAVGSTVSGGSVDIASSAGAVAITGSTVVADRDVTVAAAGPVSIGAAQTTQSEVQTSSYKRSGLSLGGDGLFLGVAKTSSRSTADSVTNAGSLIGSTGGNVTIASDDALRVTGSTIAAPGTVTLTGRSIAIANATDTRDTTSATRSSSFGLSIGGSSPLTDGARTLERMGSIAGSTGNARVAAVAGLAGSLSAKNTLDAIGRDPRALGGATASISLGFSSSRSQGETHDETAVASEIIGGNVALVARGAGAGSTIAVTGSDVRATGDPGAGLGNLTLDAPGAITLAAAQERSTQSGSNRSSGASIGVSVGVGSTGLGAPSINLGFNNGSGSYAGAATTNREANLSATGTARVTTPGTLTLDGATLAANRVEVAAGNLAIVSRQDTSTYTERNRSLGLSLSVTPGGPVSGAANFGSGRGDGSFRSVAEQAGIFAGAGGYGIDVAGATSLTGAVIASSADPSLNRLTTGTLSIADLQNSETWRASQSSFGIGLGNIGQSRTGQGTTNGAGTPLPGLSTPFGTLTATPPVALGASGGQSSTTRSAIAPGTIAITSGDAASLAAAAGVSRDTTGADPALSQQYTDAKRAEVAQGFEAARQLTGEVATFFANRGRDEQGLRDQAAALPEGSARDALLRRADQLKNDYGAGSAIRLVATALSSAAGSNVTGGFGSLVQASAVNALQGLAAQEVKKIADSFTGTTTQRETLRAALHAVVGCAGATAGGGDCGSGATGAAASVVLNNVLTGLLKNDARATLGDQEARGNVIASIAGVLAGATGLDVQTATYAATLETQNNYLTHGQLKSMADEIKQTCGTNPTASCTAAIVERYQALSVQQDVQLKYACTVGSSYYCGAASSAYRDYVNGTAFNTYLFGAIDTGLSNSRLGTLIDPLKVDIYRSFSLYNQPVTPPGPNDDIVVTGVTRFMLDHGITGQRYGFDALQPGGFLQRAYGYQAGAVQAALDEKRNYRPQPGDIPGTSMDLRLAQGIITPYAQATETMGKIAIYGGAALGGGALGVESVELLAAGNLLRGGVYGVSSAEIVTGNTRALVTGSDMPTGIIGETINGVTGTRFGDTASIIIQMAPSAFAVKDLVTGVVRYFPTRAAAEAQATGPTAALGHAASLDAEAGAIAPTRFLEATANTATHNGAADEVILGKFIPGSPDSYEAVAQARGSTYFSLDNWNDVSADIGDANMWSINRTFLDQQIARGKTFVFTADPATAPATSYTAREAAYLRLNGYRIVPDGSMFRAVKK